MQTKTEFLIWDKIVNSAKQKFDYNQYLSFFEDPKIYDQLLLHIIIAFASGESHEAIATNLHNELHHIGFTMREDEVAELIEDKHIVFSSEIYAAYLTFSMMEHEHSEFEILGYVTDLLESPKVY
ncbi:hypothetical protein [Sphingobacterium rhinopitheci]|uniref:hypothetical protein n=1 Tax=Sphingobacterium rhinopitheci TaxID=2781960 RepID=UPI001F524D3D|nr:hypothetical protein [Sphingobacterium rhinopitheci]MCI0921143.1 hypothetical protein [Sphingobacterium rhinopitheci]